MTFTFRAIWPITNERLPFVALCTQARHDIPLLLAQAHARPTGPGRWSMAESTYIPGSGRVTPWVLIYECPARCTPVRAVPTIPAAGAEGEAARQPATSHGGAAA